MALNQVLPLAITMGEPAGIGWEITLKAWEKRVGNDQPFYLLDDFNRLKKVCKNIPIEMIKTPSDAQKVFPDALPIFHMPLSAPANLGRPSTKTAPDVVLSIRQAVRHIENKMAAGVITNPIQKNILYDIGFKYPGHTEFLGALSSYTATPLMMLSCHDLKVVPITTHLNLLDAISKISTKRIINTCMLTAKSLATDFGIKNPHIAVAGLNPHAGEGGQLGEEEQKIIEPAVSELRSIGLNVSGPLSPDTLFSRPIRKTFDVAICMYHDQALIPIKTLDFEKSVNITLGLPFVRTSPDHGTALDIAGQGIANEKSMVEAIQVASSIAKYRSLGK